jgi:hypothetical protein
LVLFHIQANSKLYAATRKIFQTFSFELPVEKPNRLAAARHSFLLFNKRREKTLISPPSFSKLRQR